VTCFKSSAFPIKHFERESEIAWIACDYLKLQTNRRRKSHFWIHDINFVGHNTDFYSTKCLGSIFIGCQRDWRSASWSA